MYMLCTVDIIWRVYVQENIEQYTDTHIDENFFAWKS